MAYNKLSKMAYENKLLTYMKKVCSLFFLDYKDGLVWLIWANLGS